MGTWNVETFVNCIDVATIQSALASIFKRDGYVLSEKPSDSECRTRGQRMLYKDFTSEPLWGVAVIPCTKTGWSFLHCDPANLLCERARKSKRTRLASLAKKLSAVAFQLNVEDSTAMVLMECSTDGGYSVSGDTYEAQSDGLSAPYKFFGETIHDHDIKFYCESLKQFNKTISQPPQEFAFQKIGSALSDVARDYDDFSRHNGPFLKYEKVLTRRSKGIQYWDLKPVVRQQSFPGARDIFFRKVP